MTSAQKLEIIDLILEEIKRLGSQNAVAIKCKVSEATISQILKNKYKAQGDDMWEKIAAALNYDNSGWVLVPTTNSRYVHQVLKDSKDESMCMAISHKAGSGKSSGLDMFTDADTTGTVFKIKCRAWNHKEFLMHLCQNLGISVPENYISIDNLEQRIIDFFKVRSREKLMLAIDEADKLKPSALGFIIPLENETEDTLAIIISGTEHLEKQIKRGVKLKKKYYDEIDSRFGRNMIHLIGNTKNDVKNICAANGITDPATQLKIWKDCSPVMVPVRDGSETRHIEVVEDGRRLKRAIKRERLMVLNLQD